MAEAKKRTRKPKSEASADEGISAFKGFSPQLTCHGNYQFEVGGTYEHSGIVRTCRGGFHSCTNPFDVLEYYSLFDGTGKPNRFCVVRASGQIDRHGGDSKIASAKLTVEVELTIPQFISRCIQWVLDATKLVVDPGAGGADTGILASSERNAKIGSSGDGAQIGSSGYGAQIGSSGYGAQIGSSGDGAQIGSSGDGAQIGSSGENSVIAAAGPNTTAKGAAGTWIALPEFIYNRKKSRWECVGFVTGCVGQDGIKADTFYRAEGGKLVEAEPAW